MKRKVSKIKKRIYKNPRDENLLNQIEIRKILSPEYPSLITYKAFLNNQPIGSLHYNHKDHSQTVYVADNFNGINFRRKGVASYLYDYAEKNLGIKLRPSKHLSRDGKPFWEDRLRKNPRDKDLLKRLKIQKYEEIPGERFWWYDVYLDKIEPENKIGEFGYKEGTDHIGNVKVWSDFRRKGIANYVYDLIEKDFGIKLKPSTAISHDARSFWITRLGLRKRNPSTLEERAIEILGPNIEYIDKGVESEVYGNLVKVMKLKY